MHASMANFASSALLIQESLLALNYWSDDKEAWTKGPAFKRSLNVVTRLTSHPTLKPMPLALVNAERMSLKGKIRWSSLPVDCGWDTTSPMRSDMNHIRGSVHLSVSLIISGYFERSLEHTTFKGGESNEISGPGSASMLPFSWSLEVTSTKSSFSWGLSVHTWFKSPLLALDYVSSSESTSCIEASSAKRVVFALVWVRGLVSSLTCQRS